MPSARRHPLFLLPAAFAFLVAGCGSEGAGSGGSDGNSASGAYEGGREAVAAPTPATICDQLADVLGSGGATSGEVCRVAFPRTDLTVSLKGATLPPAMGLTSWAAFGPAGGRGSIVMGDLALTSEELPQVMAGLRENGLRVTAVHRHMLGEVPTMSFMHYLGVGPADRLARALRTALERAPTARGPAREGASESAPAAARTGEAGVVAGIRCAELARTLGVPRDAADTGPGYCKVSRPRSDLDVTVEGIAVPASMGVGSWFAFRETASGDRAVVTGDMALTQQQVNPAIRALRRAGITVVALHNHMLHDEPRAMFFHFQARGAPAELAESLRSGLEAAGLAGGS